MSSTSGLLDSPPSVQCGTEVLDQIRIAVVEGLHKIPHGGLEVGGLLLGRRREDSVSITGWEPIPCEHALGPSFSLSETDEAGLRDLLETARDGREVVGWFHSHTRSDLRLSEKDQKLHERFFPAPWQVALLLRPALFQPTRACFFRRTGIGALDPDGAEFVIEAPDRTPIAGEDARRNDTVYSPGVPDLYRPATIVQLPVRRRLARVGRAVAAAVAIALLAGILLAAWKLAPDRSSAPIALHVDDAGGTLKIQWNPHSPAITQAERGILRIRDGTQEVEHSLTPEDLQRGSMDYLRSTANVQVRLTVRRPGSEPAEELTSFIGTPVNRVATASPASPALPAAEDSGSKPSDGAAGREESSRLEALRQQEAHIEAELERLEQAKIRAEQERQTLAKAQAQRERDLQRMAEKAKADLARLEQLRAAAKPDIAALPPQLPVQAPVQLPSVPAPSASSPPQTRAQPPAPQPTDRPRYSGPESGRLIWTGDLGRRTTLTIDEGQASTGVITGRLPRQPVRIRAYPADFSDRGITIYTSDPKFAGGFQERPSRDNGWNATTYRLEPGRAGELVVIEPPAARNDWRRVVLRNDGKRLSMVVLEWELLRSARR